MKKILLIILLIICCCTIKVSATSLSAESYVLMDIDSHRVMEGGNIHCRKPTASIAKMMTLLVAISYGDLDEVVTVTHKTTLQVGSSIYLQENDEIVLRDLLYGLTLRSGNDAAYLIAETVGGSQEGFVYLMNEMAKSIGMVNSTFENPSGLDETTINYSTAYDMGLLMCYAYHNDTFKEIIGTKNHRATTKDNTYSWTHKHKMLFNDERYTGGKTGYTVLAKRTLITTAEENNMRLVVVTFNASNDWNDHKSLFDYGFNNYTNYNLMKHQIITQDFMTLDYFPYLQNDIIYPLTKNEYEHITINVYLYDNKKDDNSGYVIICLNKEEIYRTYLSDLELDSKSSNTVDYIKGMLQFD